MQQLVHAQLPGRKRASAHAPLLFKLGSNKRSGGRGWDVPFKLCDGGDRQPYYIMVPTILQYGDLQHN